MIEYPEFVVRQYVNQHHTKTGIDSLDQCLDVAHFKKYPHDISYDYNSRGFRDQEWPTAVNELQQAIWCVGDSFTVGLGSPIDHIWPQVVSQATNRRTINISLNGASNNWISHRACRIIELFAPTNIVIMWSYTHRRHMGIPGTDNTVQYPTEPAWRRCYTHVRKPGWPDCDTIGDFNLLPQEIRQLVIYVIGESAWQNDLSMQVHYTRSTDQEDVENLRTCVSAVAQAAGNTRIVHAAIPNFAPVDYRDASMAVLAEQPHNVPYFKKLDLARDGHHFDRLTADWVAAQVVPQLIL